MITQKDLVLTDQEKGPDGPLHEYLNSRGIIFDFIQEVDKVKMIDLILYKRQNQNQRIALVLSIDSILRLCNENKKLSNVDFFQKHNILLVHCERDTTYRLIKMPEKDYQILKPLPITCFNEGIAGNFIKQKYPNFTFLDLHHGHFNWPVYHGELVKKNTDRNKRFMAFFNAVGHHRRHRKMLYDTLEQNSLLYDSIVKVHTEHSVTTKPSVAYSSNSYPDLYFKNTRLQLQLPDLNTYGQTNFEIVCESLGAEDNDDTFFLTEKTLKPIVMKHPFIILGPQNYLQTLKQLGFKTFGDFVDESYDKCGNTQQRIDLIAQQVKMLTLEQSNKFYNSTRQICQHNLDNFYYLHGKYKSSYWNKLNTFFARPDTVYNNKFPESFDSQSL